jgi:hypothetical protein
MQVPRHRSYRYGLHAGVENQNTYTQPCVTHTLVRSQETAGDEGSVTSIKRERMIEMNRPGNVEGGSTHNKACTIRIVVTMTIVDYTSHCGPRVWCRIAIPVRLTIVKWAHSSASDEIKGE